MKNNRSCCNTMRNFAMESNDYHAMAILKAYVVGQAKLGYARFKTEPRSDDVFLVTFPKSGSTWTSYLLHQIRSRGNDDFIDIKNEVIDITPGHWDPQVDPFLIEQNFSPRTFKTHGSYDLCPRGGKYIYLARDPKDTLFSLYCFIHDLFGIEDRMSIESFFQHYYVERFGTDHDIGNAWNHFLQWHPHKDDSNMLWLHYEDLLEDRDSCIRAIADFMEVELSEASLDLVLAHSSMQHMRTIAPKINPSQNNRTGELTLKFGPEMRDYAKAMKFGKMRRGAVGDGHKDLPAAILEALDEEWRKRITPVLGYTDYAQMRASSSLLRQPL